MSEPNDTHVAPLRIDRAHPALAGHFPGRPIVPGVVLLDHVQQAVQQWLGSPIVVTRLPQAKFMAPLLPEQEAQIQLRLSGKELRFAVMRGADTIAQGLLEIARAP